MPENPPRKITFANLTDRRATLWAAFAGDHPYRVPTFQAGGTAAARNLGLSVCCTCRWLSFSGEHTGMVVMPSTS